MATSRSDTFPGQSLRKDGRPAPPFHRVLIANRGEIAVRVIRACHEMGMEAVAVFSDVDAHAAHVRLADRAVRIGPSSPAESYLNIEAVMRAVLETGADAVHPGYGFLAERAAFARAIEDIGVAFIGPSSTTIGELGDKLHARRIARAVGVDAVPGTLEPARFDRPDQVAMVVAEADAIGYPLLVKAAAGGGGRGMRRVESSVGLPEALLSGSREAASAFGDGSVYLEREVNPARHIEVQLLGDATGQVIALGERDCSVQRRHQKLLEEAPAPGLSRGERAYLHELAVRMATAAKLQNAATAEFLRAPDGAFYFLEVNTRLQVEHGVTELVSGLDIVQEQFLLAAGRPLSPAALTAASRATEPSGHAIEVRLSAEDPGRDFAPSPGTVRHWSMPAGPGVRVDTAIEAGASVPAEYDNLIAKIMVHASDRDTAIDRLRRTLDEAEVAGIQTTLPFHRFLARDASFRAADLSTGWVGEHWDGPAEFARAAAAAQLAAGLAALQDGPGARAAPAAAPHAIDQDAPGDGAWRRAGLLDALDRWPQ